MHLRDERSNIEKKRKSWLGFVILDDENGKMNYLLKIPREGFGFSNYLHKGIKVPTFNDFSFTVEKNKTIEINVTMKYL